LRIEVRLELDGIIWPKHKEQQVQPSRRASCAVNCTFPGKLITRTYVRAVKAHADLIWVLQI
jgi:hypothetical protein